MRIISRGTMPEDKLYKATCGYCKTVFECKKHEGQSYVNGMLNVLCPVCGKQCIAHERNDGNLIPRHDRNSWDGGLHSSIAHQMEHFADQSER